MSSWSTSTKHEPIEINSGQKYDVGDQLALEQLNAITENSFYAISLAESVPEKSNAFPSDTYETLSPANNQTYTAPANGYFAWICVTTSASYANVTIKNDNNGMWYRQGETATGAGIYGFFPVKKGDVVTLTYSNVSFTGASDRCFRFYYAEGEVQ